MREQPWNNPEWNEVRDEAKEAIATARRSLQRVGAAAGEKLSEAVASLENARIRGRIGDICTATADLRRTTEDLLSLAALSEPRNGTSGVTGVENPDGEPNHGNGDA